MNSMRCELKDVPVIILAAGDSKRIGFPKGLLDYHGTPFLTHQLLSLYEIGFSHIIVVLGHTAEQLKQKIKLLRSSSTCINPQPERGPFSSIQCGLKSLVSDLRKGVFILPVDVPCP